MVRLACVVTLLAGGLFAGCSGGTPAGESTGEVGARGVARMDMRPARPSIAQTQVPAFPQKFDVEGPESSSFGFAVTQPGSIVVDVQAQGAPVIVTLESPGGQPIVRQAAGNLRIHYTVTPQDVQRSLFWQVQLRLAQPGGRASGTVSAQYPSVDQTAVQQAVQAMAAQQQQPSAQELEQSAAQTKARMEEAFQQRRAQFEQQREQRRVALHAQIQPQLDQLRSRAGGQVRPRGLEQSEGTSVESGASPEGEVGTRGLQLERIQKIMPLASVPAPPPAIASLSVPQGQPGDPVLINGSGFGMGGEVHFVVAPGRDVIAPAGATWTDAQIFATVPDASGLLGFNGTVYVKRTDGVVSNLVQFRFDPARELRQFNLSKVPGQDWTIQWPGEVSSGVNVYHFNGNPFWGYSGTDMFFPNVRLKNGWTFARTLFAISRLYDGRLAAQRSGAYIRDQSLGTNNPYLTVRWWTDAAFAMSGGSFVKYEFSIEIEGPKGVPDGVVVP